VFRIVLVITINIIFSFAKAEEFSSSYHCLSNCLDKIKNYRYFYDVALFNIHNNVESNLHENGLSLDYQKVGEVDRHLIVDFLLNDKNSSELISAKKKLVKVYQNLLVDCEITSKRRLESLNSQRLPEKSLVDGVQRFGISRIFESAGYKLKIQDALAKGFGIGGNDLEYDPVSMSFKIRVGLDEEDDDYKILFNESKISLIKEKLRVKKVSGEPLSQEEIALEKKALTPAKFIYIGTINIMDLNSDCRLVQRGEKDESYCPKGLKTFWRRVQISTGVDANISKSEKIHPFYISDNIKGGTIDQTSSGNISQINSTLKLLESSVCQNRNEIYSEGRGKSGFHFKMPCGNSVLFPIPAPISNY
jgi:hypothetical protein